MGSVAFTDSIGAATFTNGLEAIAAGVGSRFASWTPWTMPIGPNAHALGTGARYQYTFRTDYGATFEIREIPATGHAIALRLIRHLKGGGTCSVATGDGVHAYATCGLAPGFEPALSMTDSRNIRYSLALSLINLGAAADMLCEY